ncbi:MAG: MATE family efflux transporter [Clostridiales bacterium]|uniref:MATE family efflux transporter n=1 Tax=Terrisporobacter sp. TaxID=1965305 RepID=UPI002A424A86|nr:MATE family efflux transporter [Terrisporobacter sp.]MDD5879310.1 MATE family efflux transporter [Clostridiales bacterium]MDD7755508.1 MATE family efflux transporter [Clostridiales bacterium]MDY4134870.1 MATE family efflux transporter [Terrisporobacter sp.]MDY4737768.1 MATE family efflux transporter [Terrisporobacter sp.]
MTNDMTKGNPLKIFIFFSIPLLIGNVFQQLYSMVDTIIVGRFVGVEALAAVGSTGSMFFLVNGMILGLTSGFGVLVAQKFGAKDEVAIKKAVASNIILTLVLTVFITIIALLVKNPLLRMMNTPDNIFNDASTYITIIFAGIITQALYNMAAGILRALGDSKTPLYFLMVSSIVNVILDLVFIINFKMGVSGAAYATNIAQGFSAVLCLIYSYKKFQVLRLKKEDFKVELSYYTKHLKVGVPMGLQFSVTAVGIIIVQSAINVFGSTVIASYTASSKVLQLVMQPATSFGVTIANYSGQNLGAGRFDRIKSGMKIMNKVSIITSLLAGLVLIFLGKYFVRLFIENPTAEIFTYSQLVFNYSAVFFIPLGFIFVYRNVLQGMGESFMPMMAGVLELIARSIVAFTLPKYIGFTGICLSDPVAWIAASVFLMITYYKKMKKIEIENKEGIAV